MYSEEVLCSTERVSWEICSQFNRHIIFPIYKCYQIPAVNAKVIYKVIYWESSVLISK